MNTQDLAADANSPLSGHNLALTDQQQLLTIARETLARYLVDETIPVYEISNPRLQQEATCFVTLRYKAGELRGCVGQLKANGPLYRMVQLCAVSAATRDIRFTPVDPTELPDLRIEISVLSPFRLVESPEEIQIGRDGLLLRHRQHTGLLLPQVATDRGWDRETFLEALCHKADLPKGSWQYGDLYRFSCQVLEEE